MERQITTRAWLGISLGLLAVIAVLALFKAQKSSEPRGGVVTTIGVITGLTGTSAGVYGDPLSKGIEVALEEINSEGEKIKVEYQDYQIDTKLALSAYNELKTQGIRYFLIDGSPAAAVLGAEIRKDNNLAIVPSAFLPSYRDDSPLTCRLALTADGYAPAMADVISSQLQKRRVVLLLPQVEAGTALEEEFKAQAQKHGLEVVLTEHYEREDTDFRAQLTKIKSLPNVEVLLVSNYFTSAEPMFKQIREFGLSPVMVSDNWTINNNQALKDIQLVEGVYFVDYAYSPDQPETNIGEQFVRTFESKYGTKPGLQSALGYDILKLFDLALTPERSSDPASVAEFLTSQVKNYNLASGVVSFNKDCEVERDFAIRRVENGKIISVQE